MYQKVETANAARRPLQARYEDQILLRMASVTVLARRYAVRVGSTSGVCVIGVRLVEVSLEVYSLPLPKHVYTQTSGS